MKDRSTITRYIMFQAVELTVTIIAVYIIWHFFDLPLWLAFVVVLIFIIKDFILYFYTWRSYVLPSPNDHALMIGKRCIAANNFDGEGRVRYNGEIWKAKLVSPGQVRKGDSLLISDVNGLQLLVQQNNDHS